SEQDIGKEDLGERPFMNRRDFIAGAATGLVVGAAGTYAATQGKQKTGTGTIEGAPAVVRDRQEWRMLTAWPDTFPGLGTGAERLARRITDMSDGRLTVKVIPAGAIVPALQVFDTISQGSAEMGHG